MVVDGLEKPQTSAFAKRGNDHPKISPSLLQQKSNFQFYYFK
jgi:hypothetical protein